MKRTSVTAIAAMIAKTSSTVRKDGLLVGRLSLIEGFLDGLSVSVIVMISYQAAELNAGQKMRRTDARACRRVGVGDLNSAKQRFAKRRSHLR